MAKRFNFESFDHLCESAFEKPDPSDMDFDHILGHAVVTGVLSIEDAYALVDVQEL